MTHQESMMNQDRWEKLMGEMGLQPSLDCFADLFSAYSEKHRFYHTSAHIDAMLKNLDSTIDLSDYPNEIELAIWFHDAVYKPLSSTNEVDSANLAKVFLLANDYKKRGIERVYKLIMSTLHNSAVVSIDEQLIVDIDLSILGAQHEVYDEFERKVRKEYRLVPSFIYRKKRKQLLKSFLLKDSIYTLDYFKNRYEKVARENIKRAINIL